MCAVHNGRFHHATASWALEEQLATRRIPRDQRVQLSLRFGKTRPVVRSQSSAVFSGDGDDDAASFVSECHEDAAAGEWAVALVKVADQSMDMEGAAHFFGRVHSRVLYSQSK